MSVANSMTLAPNPDLEAALALTDDDIQRMSTPDLRQALELLLGTLTVPELEAIRQRIVLIRGGRA